MNILLLNWQDISNPLGGGAEVHYHEIFRRLVARGHEVTLFCSSYEGAPAQETMDGITVLRRGTRNTFNFTLLRSFRHVHSSRPFEVVVDDLNKIPFFTPFYVRTPLLTIVHHLFGASIFQEAAFPAAAYVWGMEWAALPVYRKGRFAAVSESTKAELIGRGVSAERIHIAGNAVDHSVYRTLPTKRERGPTVGYLGRLKQYKSIDHLLNAFAVVLKEIPSARLVVVGDGDVRPKLERLASELGIGSATSFLGYVDERRKVEELNACDIVVNPSAKEGWGLTVIEANACGVPVIASNVPGLRDSVVHERTGILYPYGNISELSRQMVRLLRNSNERAQLGKEAFAWAGTFTWERSADNMEAALKATVEEWKRARI